MLVAVTMTCRHDITHQVLYLLMKSKVCAPVEMYLLKVVSCIASRTLYYKKPEVCCLQVYLTLHNVELN